MSQNRSQLGRQSSAPRRCSRRFAQPFFCGLLLQLVVVAAPHVLQAQHLVVSYEGGGRTHTLLLSQLETDSQAWYVSANGVRKGL